MPRTFSKRPPRTFLANDHAPIVMSLPAFPARAVRIGRDGLYQWNSQTGGDIGVDLFNALRRRTGACQRKDEKCKL
jgi:hypothetical protein